MNHLDVPNLQSSYCRQGVVYRGPTIYQSIPLEIRSIEVYKALEYNVTNYNLELQ